MGVKHLLDLAREHVEPFDEHHVFLAVGDEQEPVRVEVADDVIDGTVSRRLAEARDGMVGRV